MSQSIEYVVKSGDCLSSIAKTYGFTWKQLWNYGGNSELRALRKNPNILMPGDVVHVPALQEDSVSRGVDAHHKFKRKSEQSQFRLRLLVDGKPLAKKQCVLEIHEPTGTVTKNGATDGDGNVLIEGATAIRISGNTETAELRVGTGEKTAIFHLSLGHLASAKNKDIGVMHRLANLGHLHPTYEQATPAMCAAIKDFQRIRLKQKNPDGNLSDAVRSQIEEKHGC